MLPFVLLGILLFSESCLLSVAQEVCTSLNIGSNIQEQFSDNSPNIDRRYYLNIADPAHCSGFISRVNYCYYGPSQYNSKLAWGASVAIYRPQADGSYRRLFPAITLSKSLPFNQRVPNPRTDLLLNFNCDTYLLNSFLRVQKGDVFGALIFQFRTLSISVGGLELVGDTSCGYQMLTRSVNTIRIESSITDRRIQGLEMLETLTGLSLDTGKRVLHVFADIIPEGPVIIPIRPSMKPTTSCVELITTAFMKSTLSPTRTTTMFVKTETAIIPSGLLVKSTRLRESTTVVKENPYSESIDSPQTTTQTIAATENTSRIHNVTASSTWPHPTEGEILQQSWIKITGGVLGAMVIIVLVSILSTIGIVVVVIRKKGRKASVVDLTSNEAYTERAIHTPLIDDHDRHTEAIEYHISDTSEVPLELNAAYMMKSPIYATRNVAYENTSEFDGYEYINAQ